MEKKITEIIDFTIKFREYLQNNRLDLKNKIIKFCKQFEDIITKLKTIKEKEQYDVRNLLEKYQGWFFRIHDTLVGKIAKLYVDKEDLSRLRKVHDMFFTEFLGIKMPRKRFAFIATKLTTEFCKGITYFANNSGIDQIPFYHRDTSCGPFDKRNMKNKLFVKNCYIERLIYEQIYSNVFMEQDVRHRVELKNVELLYEKMYPDENLYLKVGFSDGIHPDSITIEYRKDFDNIVDSYTKKWNQSIVVGKRYDIGNKILYTKIQSFESESPWLKNDNII
jgi:hypothetical protein